MSPANHHVKRRRRGGNVAFPTAFVALVLASLAPAAPKSAAPRQVFSDDFEADAPGPQWSRQSGSWTIIDRALYCMGPGIMVCRTPLPRNVRVEYDCMSKEPCDMTLLLGKTKVDSRLDGYFFGFGSMANTVNKLMIGKRQVAADTKHLPIAGQWHHVVVEKRGRFLTMWIDGEKSLSACDFKEATRTGRYWGFYVWTKAKFDNVKAFELPADAVQEPQEPQPKVKRFFSFANDALNGKPAGLEAIEGNRCSVKVVDFPNTIYGRSRRGPTTVQDRCVELRSGGWGSAHVAGMRAEFEPVSSGFVELDVMAASEALNGGRVQLLSTDGAALAAFGWDDDGRYFNLGPDGRRALDCRVGFPHRSTKTLIRQQAGRWLTLRIDFDAKAGEYDAALLGYYTRMTNSPRSKSPDELCNRLVLAANLPFRQRGQVAMVALTTGTRSHLLVDNLVVFGPAGPHTINGKDRRSPAADLLGLKFEPRRDPFRMTIYSSRHCNFRKGPKREQRTAAYKPFKEAGENWSRLMVRQARAEEMLRAHQRAAYYLDLAAKGDDALRTALDRARRARAKSNATLEAAYQAFAIAYTDQLNAQKLKALYGPAERKLTQRIAALEASNAKLAGVVYAHAANVPPLERCAAGGDLRNLVWRNGRYERDGVPAHVHTQETHVVWWQAHAGLERALDLPCCERAYRTTRGCKPGELNDLDHFRTYWGKYVDTRPYATYEIHTSYGAHDIWMTVPKWWIEQAAKQDPEVLFRGRDGKPLGLPEGKVWTKLGYQGPTSFLNYWHPQVLKLMEDTGREYGAFLAKEYPKRTISIIVGAEQIHAIYGNETGHNKSTRPVFVNYLKHTYGGDIARLNAAWGTKHRTFDEITPPPERAKKPSGVAYEFQRFRQDGYMNWVRTIARGFRESLGNVPLVNYYNITFGGIDRVVGFDMVKLFKTYDVNCYHTFHRPSWFPMSRCLDSLRKAYPGKALGRMEWAGSTTCPDMSDERAYLANGLGLQFCDMAWGLTYHSIWYGTMGGWAEGAHWTNPRLGNSVLRYSSSFIPLSIERCRALGRPAAEYPTVQPDVALLEVTSSFLNAIPDSLYWLGVRRAMGAAAAALEDAYINYGVLYEEPVLEGRQKLDGHQVVIVPAGICSPPQLADLLMAYVRRGGMLVLLGPCGLYDQYGKPDNRLLAAAFPGVEWHRSGRGWWISGNAKRYLRDAPKYGKSGRVLRTRMGLGTVVVFTDLTRPDRALLQSVIEPRVRRTYDVSDREHFQMVVREAPDCYYIYIVNMDWQQTREARVAFARPTSGVFDMGCGKPMPVPYSASDGATQFWVRLEPAEGTVLRVGKR